MARRRRRRSLLPVALLLLTLTVVCAVIPVAINMTALQLKSKAVEMDAVEQELRDQVRDVEARVANLNSAAHLKEQVEKMGMASASSFSYLEPGDSSTRTASANTTSSENGSASNDVETGVGTEVQTGVAWLGSGGSSTNGSDAAQNR